MRRALSVVAILFALCNPALADLYAPYSGANFSGMTRNSTIAEYDSTVRESDGALLDLSGSNYFTYSSQFDNAAWEKLPATASITADAVRCPVGSNGADLFVEGTAGSGNTNQIAGQRAPTITTGTYTLSIYALYKAGGRPWVILRNAGAANRDVWFNIQTGAVGTVESAVLGHSIRSVGGGWYRLTMQTTDTTPGSTWAFRAASADGSFTYTGDGRGAFYVCGAQLAQNDVWRTGPGVYHSTVAENKPILDLTPTATPTESKTYFQGQDGRRLKARTFNGTTQHYSKTHDASMNVFSAAHTMTFAFMQTSTGSGTDYLFSHGTVSTDGAQVFSDGTSVGVRWSGASTASADYTLNARDDRYHVLQAVRTSSTVKILVDGVLGQTAAANGGTDVSQVMYLGNSAGLNRYWDGSILYARIDAEALTDEQLAKEREKIQGTLASQGLYTKANFTRASTGAVPFSDGTFGYVATNVPRVGGDGGGALIEEQRQNILTYSQNQANAAWGVTNLTNPPVAYTGTDPAGTTTGYVLAEDGTAAAEHKIARSAWVTVVAGTTYTFSAYVKAINRSWTALHIYENGGTSYYAYFNVVAGIVGTTSGGPTTKIEQLADGWYRCSVTHAMGAGITQVDTAIYVAEADNDWTFSGATQSSLAVFGAQMEVGAHATSYIPTTSAATTRYADDLTYTPWQISKNMFAAGNGRPMFWYNFDQQVYSGSTVTSSGGNYTLTTVGNPKLYSLPNDSTYTSFDGVSDYFTLSSADFNPTGAFSIVAVYTPGVGVGTGNIISKDIVATRGPFQLLDNGGAPQLTVWNAADTTSTASGAALVAGKTSLVTATYDGAGNTRVMVDSGAAGTGYGAITTPKSTANLVYIGTSAGAQQYLGDMRFIAYYNGIVVTQAQHDAMYATLKDSRGLPVKIGNSYEAKKLYVEFDAKCNFANKTDAGGSVSLFEISGNTGTADSNTNRIAFLYGSDGKLYFEVWADAEDTERYMLLNTVLTDMNTWHRYKAMYDFTNLASSSAYRDSTSQNSTGDLSGAKNFDFTNTKVRINQTYTDSTAYSSCTVRNLRIRATP